MVFSSLEFIYIFLPIFLIFYYIFPSKYRNALLFIGSIIFYSVGTLDHPLYILLMLVSILVNYLLALGVEKTKKHGKFLLTIGIIYNFGWLFVFKYSDFLFTGINSALKAILPNQNFSIPLWNLILPIGISFYTFQIVSYLVDVYRKTCPAEHSIINLGTYICMFPQLIAGPIVTYSSIREQLKERTYSIDKVKSGIEYFILGLGFKVLLANPLGSIWSDVTNIGFESISTPLAWIGIIAFSFQIYLDFFGYSLMAIGLGHLLGFKLPENFNHPYISTSMTEFWRRWHITLGSWFREYVYFPLGGSKEGKLKTIRNLLIVWMFTGLWHGAHLNFLLWGFLLFAIITIEKFFLKKPLDKYPIIGHLYMILLIPLSWAIFAITDINQLGIFFGRLFPFFSQTSEIINQLDYLKYLQNFGWLLILGLIFSTKLPLKIYNKIKDKPLGIIMLIAIFWGATYCMYIGLNDPFLYFRF